MLAKRVEVCPLQTNKSLDPTTTWCMAVGHPGCHCLTRSLSHTHTHKQRVSIIPKSGLESVQGDRSSLLPISLGTISTRDDL